MAARRLASTTNWASLGARMPGGNCREVYVAAKTSTESQMVKIISAPAALPAIDWNMYSRLLPGVAMVDDFKAKYESITVAYPVDAGSKLAVAAAADASVKNIAAEVVQEVDAKCAGSKKDIGFFEKLPVAQSMTYEMYLELFPNASAVVPKERDQLEAELADVNTALVAKKAMKA